MYVSKRPVTVRVAQFGHDPLDGAFALAQETDAQGQPTTIFELLNSSLRVIPFIVREDGSIILLTRRNIDWVMVDERVDGQLVLPKTYVVAREEPVELQFMSGTTIDGLLQIDSQNETQRASDFLNLPEDFYPVLTRLGTLLVNKDRVKETRLGTVSPAWAPSRGAGDSNSPDAQGV
jgi:hypothetical protein